MSDEKVSPSASYAEKADAKDRLYSPAIDESLEKRVWRKLDRHLLPFVTLLYLLSFLDRANIGNAKIAGMSTDLHLTQGFGGLKYNFAAAIFYIPYSLCEVPSNILLKLMRPSIWIPSIMVAWGTVITLMCRVESFQGLVIARVFLGLAEAGLFPGVTFYISLWYPRRMQAARVAIFFAGATVAGAFGGILAYGIERLEGRGGLHGWQWIFLIEGLATVVVAAAAYFFMHDYPETARFLTEEERDFVITTLRADSNNQATHFEMRFVWQAFADWKSWVQVIMYTGILIPVYAIALFMPSVIAGLGYTNANAQLLTIPPFVLGCFFTVLVGIYSDRLKLRGPFFIVCCTVSMVGYIIAYTTSKPGPGYAAVIIAAIGVYPTVAVILAWAGGNAGGDMKRGVVIAMVIGFGNLGGICSSFVYNDPPRYHHGHGAMIGWLGLSIVCSLVLMYTYRRLNREKEEYCKREGITIDMQDQFKDMADKSPLFRYII
ncbi:MFS general substrate transporter [Vararia minispora EC-137]|uniref:MFS general substrate transporter n=1 Tax=Vararia minispora EC-137 TaxID=1314806 RepID=A0ACB8QM58_9AGAM|nr:MFS general substrate transporter [Vararia minispora EC-137]